MSEVAMGFEEKVQGLVDYYRALEDLDPKNPEQNELANPSFFYYAGGHHASSPLQDVKRGVVFDLECHGRVEYGRRGFDSTDLREDTDGSREERADILAVMTAPLETTVREERAERIASLLKGIVEGETLRLTEYDGFRRDYKTPRETSVDVSRALFGVFRNGHVSSRALTIQYDTPTYFAPTDDVEVGEPVIDIEIPDLFRVGGFSGETKLLAETKTAVV